MPSPLDPRYILLSVPPNCYTCSTNLNNLFTYQRIITIPREQFIEENKIFSFPKPLGRAHSGKQNEGLPPTSEVCLICEGQVGSKQYEGHNTAMMVSFCTTILAGVFNLVL